MTGTFTQQEEYLQQGRTLLSSNKYPEAIAAFEKAVEADPMQPTGYFHMGEAYIMMDDFETAKEWFSKVLLIEKQNGEAYFHLGNIELLLGEVEEGKRLFAKALNCGYDDPQLYVNLASTEESANRFTQALTYYNKAIVRDRSCIPAKVRKTEIYIMMKKHREALQAAEDLIETNPEVFEGHHYKFNSLLELGRVADADACLAFALKLFPDDGGILFDRVHLLSLQNKYSEALALLDKRFPGGSELEPKIQRMRAKMLLSLGREVEARKILEESMAARPESATVYILNLYYMSREEYENVVKYSKWSMEQSESNPYYYSAVYFHALGLSKLGRKQEAQEAFRAAADTFRMACSQNGALGDLYVYRAICHKELGDYDKAMELCNYIITVMPDTAEGYLVRSEIYKAWNDPERAEADRRLAEEKNPKLTAILG